MLGPGLMLAASAVGVSHLVQSTRVGSDYGLSLAWVIVFIAVLKYPAFRFAVDYASVTNRSLVHAYAEFGKIAQAWLLTGFAIDLVIATSAVALVTAGLLISIFGLPFSGPQVALAVVGFSAIVLLNGSYRKAEFVVKVLVVLFSLMTLIAMAFALPYLGSDSRGFFGEVNLDRSFLVFLIAVMGWMPLPLTGSIYLSVWVREKRRITGAGFNHGNATRDLRFGWILTIVLALCFVILGTAVLFHTPRVVPTNAGQFANQLLGIFTAVIGEWTYPVIAITAVAVMWSSVLALMDGPPRVTANLFGRGSYTRFLFAQVFGVAVVLLLIGNFATFIDFATSAGFVTAPAIAWYNYRAVTSEEVARVYRPSRTLIAWNWIGMLAMFLFAVAFFVERLS